ncbi:hypothetical protein L484_005734 [Morus notabilis]|uniref:Uncharacterized protein n=1 Tax=Morus notabilis TaxID=981085 RepID=W9QBP6_9ROSA|nr:hypothetical protein L484_005734 [Morus notabilis]
MPWTTIEPIDAGHVHSLAAGHLCTLAAGVFDNTVLTKRLSSGRSTESNGLFVESQPKSPPAPPRSHDQANFTPPYPPRVAHNYNWASTQTSSHIKT